MDYHSIILDEVDPLAEQLGQLEQEVRERECVASGGHEFPASTVSEIQVFNRSTPMQIVTQPPCTRCGAFGSG